MSKDSDVCGDPACDGMSVTIQGDILRADNVAFEGRCGGYRERNTGELRNGSSWQSYLIFRPGAVSTHMSPAQ